MFANIDSVYYTFEYICHWIESDDRIYPTNDYQEATYRDITRVWAF